MNLKCRNVLQQLFAKAVSKYIKFKDSVVASICATNWGDGNGITYEQAKAVTSHGSKFKSNTTITSFDEFQYFTGIKDAANLFNGCTSLVSTKLGMSNCTSLSAAFYGCTSLFKVGISEDCDLSNVKSTSYMFSNCSSITDCSFLKDCDFSGVTTTTYMFDNCTNLSKLPYLNLSNATNLNSVYYMFRKCSSLQSIFIDIGYFGMNNTIGCSSLKIIDLGSAIIGMAESSLNTSALNYLVVRATTPPTLGGSFSCKPSKYIFVPSDAVTTYQEATNWSTYSSYIKAIGGDEWTTEFGSSDEYADYTYYGVTPPTE